MDFQVGERQDVMNFGGQAERFICRKHHWQVEMSEQKKLVLVLDQAFNSEEMLLYCFLGKSRGDENCTTAKAVIKLLQGFDIIIHQKNP